MMLCGKKSPTCWRLQCFQAEVLQMVLGLPRSTAAAALNRDLTN